MVNSHDSLDLLYEVYKIVGSSDFISRDLPADFKHILFKLDKQGYLIHSGYSDVWYYDRNKRYQRYRIASRYISRLENR